jgi:catechol 2,3-dioxygenase-like lactoylglutathione lyase family enzyme
MPVPHLLDHIVIAGPDLAETVEWFRELTGITPAPGGSHPTGTANALVALTVGGERRPHYLELIGPDPEREGEELPKTFSINRLKRPTLITYAVHPEDIDQVAERSRAAGVDPGPIEELSRTTAGLTDLPTIELVSFERIEVKPEPLQQAMDALDLGDGAAAVQQGPGSRFVLQLRTEDGREVEI